MVWQYDRSRRRRAPIQRSDLRGLLQCGGALTYNRFVQQLWVGFALSLFIYGTMVSIYGSGNHELTDGTVSAASGSIRCPGGLRVAALVQALGIRPEPYLPITTTPCNPDGDREVVTHPSLPLLSSCRSWPSTSSAGR